MLTSWLAAGIGILLASGLTAAVAALAARRQRDRWAGRKVVVRGPAVPFGRLEPDGTFVQDGYLDSAVVVVTGRRGDWLGVRQGGKSGWFLADTAVPLEQAPAYFTEQIRQSPHDPYPLVYRGIAFDALGQAERAIAEYTEAIRLDPGCWLAYHCRGNAWGMRKEFVRAIADFEELARLNPTELAALIGRGTALYDAGQKEAHDRAEADFTAALRLDPSNREASTYRGWARYMLKKHTLALADFTEAARLAPSDAWARLGVGTVLVARRCYPRALAELEEALRLSPDYAEALNELAWVLATCPDPAYRDGARAVQLAIRACERNCNEIS